jgi:type IV pilus assembly protein PilQ
MESEGPGNTVTRVAVQPTDEGKRVVIEGENPLTYTFFRLVPEPLQLVVDIPQAQLGDSVQPTLEVNDEMFTEIRATETDGKTEVAIGLRELTKYDVQKEGNVVTVSFQWAGEGAGGLSTGEKEQEITEEPVVTAEAPAPETVSSMESASELVDVSADPSQPDMVVVKLKGDGEFRDYRAFALEQPARLVVDLQNIRRVFPQKSITVDSAYVAQVRLGDHPDKVRVVVDVPLEEVPGYRLERTGDELHVVVGKADVVKMAAAPPVEVPEVMPSPQVEEREPTRGAISGIDFKQLPEISRLIVSTPGKMSYEVTTSEPDTVVVQIYGAVIPQKWIRFLDTTEFASPVEMITPMNLVVADEPRARLLVKLRQMVAYEARQEENKIYLDFQRPEELRGDEPKPTKVITVTKTPAEEKEIETAAEEVAKAEVAKAPAEEVKEGRVGRPTAVTEPMVEEKVYTGKRMTLDFKDAEIGNILRLFAEVSDLNIIATDDVKGKVTIRLVDVPWDQAMDIILQANNLGMERIGNVIRIAPLARLSSEKEAKIKAMKATEELEPLATELIAVNYGKAGDLAPKVKDVLSERGTVTIDERTNTLIVKDIASGLEDAKELVTRLDTKTPQVLIQAKIVEANTNWARELGISWGGSYEDIVNAGDSRINVDGSSVGTRVVDLPATVGTGSGGAIEFAISNIANTKLLEIELSALEESGEGRILSSPRITTLDHTEAYIEQGVRIPYPKLTEEGTVTTEFIEANLKLTVTPHVTADGHVKMEIIASKDSPDFTQSVLGVPAIDKKEAKTEVLVKDGEVVVIGGVYTFDTSDTMDGVPFLHKIPLIGLAFKKTDKERETRELLIFISPRIVQPRRLAQG